ncbi:MAG: HPr family phosphocarrier protein [Lachnospiraceae bacterium]|nr:HPr family phosphocarrier protein [Lachnospiraceae bacterium]
MNDEISKLNEMIKALGGDANILSVTNCMTRLRVTVKDEDRVDAASLEKREDVLALVHDRKNAYEIVVGPGRCRKYADTLKTMLPCTSGTDETEKGISAPKKVRLKELLKVIGDIFVPLIPGVMTAGLCAGFAAMLKSLCPGYGDVRALSLLYSFLTLISTSFMTYITAWAGYRAAERFGATPIIGGMLGMMTSLDGINQIALALGLYNEDAPLSSVLCAGKGGVLAVIIGVYILSLIEKSLRPKIPDSLNMILTPFLSLIICSVMYIGVVMPVFGFISGAIATVIGDLCFSQSILVRAVTGYISAALFLPLVATGMHHGLVALYTVQLEELGYVILYPALAMAGAGQVGAAISIIGKAKKAGNENIIRIAKGALPAGILGVGEPLIYGVTLPLGRPFITASIGAGFGGAFIMVNEVASTTWGPSGVLGVFVMTAGPNGVLKNAVVYMTSLLIACIGGYIVTSLFFSEKELAVKESDSPSHNKTAEAERRKVKHGESITLEMQGGFYHTVTDPFGIHVRPASELIKLARSYDAQVSITSGGKTVSCTAMADIISLGAAQGTRLFVSAGGPQKREALEAVRNFMEERL